MRRIQLLKLKANMVLKLGGRLVRGVTIPYMLADADLVRISPGHFQSFCNFMDFAETLELNISFSHIFVKRGASSLYSPFFIASMRPSPICVLLRA